MPNTPSAKPTGTPAAGDYRYMGTHATEMQVGDTLPWLEPGEIVTLSVEDAAFPKAQEMIDSGVLVDISTIPEDVETELQEMTATSDKAEATATTTDSTKGGK